jgi:dinuclear metal center YbgI/SA1388 family protein
MKLGEISRALQSIAPVEHAEPWDNVGLLVGDPASDVESVLLAIDATAQVIDEAAAERCALIVAYHPPIFDGLKRFVAGQPAFEAARRGIAIYSPHTALDVAAGGTNDVLADAIGMTARRPLRESGIGRIGAVTGSAREVLARLKSALGLEGALVSGPLEREVMTAAVGAGAGGDLLRDALAARVDLFVTGELRHHDALRAEASGLTVVALRHSASERCALPALGVRLAAACPGLRVVQSQKDHDPFTFA